MRTRVYMYFASRHRADIDLAMCGVVRRWALIGKLSPTAYALNASGGLTMEIVTDV